MIANNITKQNIYAVKKTSWRLITTHSSLRAALKSAAQLQFFTYIESGVNAYFPVNADLTVNTDICITECCNSEDEIIYCVYNKI